MFTRQYNDCQDTVSINRSVSLSDCIFLFSVVGRTNCFLSTFKSQHFLSSDTFYQSLPWPELWVAAWVAGYGLVWQSLVSDLCQLRSFGSRVSPGGPILTILTCSYCIMQTPGHHPVLRTGNHYNKIRKIYQICLYIELCISIKWCVHYESHNQLISFSLVDCASTSTCLNLNQSN